MYLSRKLVVIDSIGDPNIDCYAKTPYTSKKVIWLIKLSFWELVKEQKMQHIS